jgi:hypothetical protein
MTLISALGCETDDIPRYNLNPDVSNKRVASSYAPMSRLVPESLDGVTLWATCIIVGEVIDDGTADIVTIENVGFSIAITIAKIRVIETIVGETPSSDIIYYQQLGIADIESGMDTFITKVRKGDTCVFLIRYHEKTGRYTANDFEECVFYVDKKGNITSMSDQLFCAKYDGVSLAIFIEDAKESFYRMKAYWSTLDIEK